MVAPESPRAFRLGVVAAVLASSSCRVACSAGAGPPGREPHGACWSPERKAFKAPCGPGNEMCGPAQPTTKYHIMDNSCPGGDTDFPFYDEVHGVYHIMYQDAVGGKHPTNTVIGHAVSRDFLHWSHMPVSVWHDHTWDAFAIYTGSATVVGGKPFLIYPGIDSTHTFNLAMAIPANRSDPFYTNWTKTRRAGFDVAANPIVRNTSDDPSTAWHTVHDEWRFLANGVGPWFKNAQGKPANSSFAPIFASVNFTGQWRYVGDSPLLAGECGSLFPLPPLYPGTVVDSDPDARALPTHVHKRGCGPSTCASWGARGDHMTLGTWTDGASTDDPGTWLPFSAERTIDMGNVYAGKDFEDKPNGRRIFFGWATVETNPQTLARVVTYHPQLQQLIFSPAPEYDNLHLQTIGHLGPTRLKAKTPLALGGKDKSSMLHAADINVTFVRPKANATFGISILGVATAFVECTARSHCRVGIYDGTPKFPAPATPPLDGPAPTRVDTLYLLPGDEQLSLRAFTDLGLLEVYWMDGRVAITSPFKAPSKTSSDGAEVFASVDGVQLVEATGWEMGSIWVSPQEVLAMPRIDR